MMKTHRMKTHRLTRPNTLLAGIGMALILLLALSDPAASQNRRSSRSRREDPNLPAQRTPLPRSEVNLGAIPFRIVYESRRDTNGETNWEIIRVDADGSN